MSDPNNINLLRGAAGGGDQAKYASDVFMQGTYKGWNGTKTYRTDVTNHYPHGHKNRGRCKKLKTDGCMVMVKNFMGPNERNFYIYDTMSGRGDGDDKYGLPISAGLQDTSHKGVTITDTSLVFKYSSGDPSDVQLDDSYIYWCCFKQADKFFKMGTYTGNGGSGDRTIYHGLGCRPGMVWLKKYGGTGGTRDFLVWNAGAGVESGYFRLDDNGDFNTYYKIKVETDNTSSFKIKRDNTDTNESGGTYVWYAFGDGSDNTYGVNGDKSIIKAGEYNPSSAGVNISLGFEPDWGLFHRKAGYSSAPNPSPFRGDPYFMSQVNGGFGCGDIRDGIMYAGAKRYASDSTTGSMVRRHYDGFQVGSTGISYSQTAKNTLYFCISVDEAPAPKDVAVNHVFHSSIYNTGTSGEVNTVFTYGFELAWFDMVQNGTHSQDNRSHIFRRGAYCSQRVNAGSLNKQQLDDVHNQNQVNGTGMGIGGHPLIIDNGLISKAGNTYQYGNRTPSICSQARVTYMSRIPPIMTTLVYMGYGTGDRTIPHNLGAAPEAVAFAIPDWGDKKFFSKGSTVNSSVSDANWYKYWTDMSSTNQAANMPNGEAGYLSQNPDETNLYIGSSTNASGNAYYVNLWASYSGILKIGGYNGNGSSDGDSQNIDCGFGTKTKPGWLFIRRFTNQQDFDPSNDWYYFSQSVGFNDGGSGTKDRWISPNSARGTTNWGGANALYDQNIVNTYAGGFAVVQDTTQSESGSTSYRANLNKSGESYHYMAYAST